MAVRRTGARAALVTVVAAAVVAGAAPAGAVATNQAYRVPADKKVVVRGHGYGHGHGMSQHGAAGAAQQGRTYDEILAFYYPGTTLSRMKGFVRVLITADTTSDVLVSPAPGLSVRDLGDRSTYQLPQLPGVTRWRLNVDKGRTVIGYYDKRWRRYKPDGKEFLVGDGEFFGPSVKTLWTPRGPVQYRGRLRAATPPGRPGDRDTVNILAMDNYVRGVVPAEMPASWHPQAVRAQAVAARTYATWERNANRTRYYQTCDTTACQVYGGVSAEHPRSNEAVSATSRQILKYDGKPAFTQFSSSSGGWTARGSMPYLPAQEDPYDKWSGNPVHEWTASIDAGVLERKYPALGALRRIRVVERDGNGAWSGRVRAVVLEGTDGSVRITGDDFRWSFGLRSNWFTIEVSEPRKAARRR